MTGQDGWTSDAIALVERAIAAHGGLRKWQAVTSIRLPFRSGSGSLLRLKGYRHTFPAPREYEVHPHQRLTLFHGYPDEHHLGRYVDGNVSIERIDGPEMPLSSTDHRRTLSGLAKYRCWSPLDALYFFGYALWHYHVLPFTLTQARLVRVLERRGVPEGIDVIFSQHVHTHCRRQQVYFGGDGRIVRHDYVAEVIGTWARGAHFWEDYQRCRGVLIARRRRVVFRFGRQPTPLPVLCIQLGEPVLAV
jgi:hypothetical protein